MDSNDASEKVGIDKIAPTEEIERLRDVDQKIKELREWLKKFKHEQS